MAFAKSAEVRRCMMSVSRIREGTRPGGVFRARCARRVVFLFIAACVGGVSVGCARPLAPLPPSTSEGGDVSDETSEVSLTFGSTIPTDARLIRTPSWATLESVWGTYDAPLVNDGNVVQVAFANDNRWLLLLGRSGQLWVWDRVLHSIRSRIRACDGQRPGARLTDSTRMDPARLLVPSAVALARF